MTEIDALRQERVRFHGGSAAICAPTARARSPVGRIDEGLGLRAGLRGWRGQARLEESSINTARDLSHPLALRPD